MVSRMDFFKKALKYCTDPKTFKDTVSKPAGHYCKINFNNQTFHDPERVY